MLTVAEPPVEVPPLAEPFTVRELPVEVPSIADLLFEAERVVEERGWTTGSWEKRSGEVCVLGAVNVAALRLMPEVPNTSAFPMLRGWLPYDSLWPVRHAAVDRAIHQLATFTSGKEKDDVANVYRWNDKRILFGGRRARRFLRKAAEAA